MNGKIWKKSRHDNILVCSNCTLWSANHTFETNIDCCNVNFCWFCL